MVLPAVSQRSALHARLEADRHAKSACKLEPANAHICRERPASNDAAMPTLTTTKGKSFTRAERQLCSDLHPASGQQPCDKHTCLMSGKDAASQTLPRKPAAQFGQAQRSSGNGADEPLLTLRQCGRTAANPGA
jgi:hypothetical protein